MFFVFFSFRGRNGSGIWASLDSLVPLLLLSVLIAKKQQQQRQKEHATSLRRGLVDSEPSGLTAQSIGADPSEIVVLNWRLRRGPNHATWVQQKTNKQTNKTNKQKSIVTKFDKFISRSLGKPVDLGDSLPKKKEKKRIRHPIGDRVGVAIVIGWVTWGQEEKNGTVTRSAPKQQQQQQQTKKRSYWPTEKLGVAGEERDWQSTAVRWTETERPLGAATGVLFRRIKWRPSS